MNFIQMCFYLRFRALSKVSSVGTILPPDQMCNSMKGSLIKKQVCLMLHINKSTICLAPKSLQRSRSRNRLDAPNSGFISPLIIYHGMAESYRQKSSEKRKTEISHSTKRRPRFLTASGASPTAIKLGEGNFCSIFLRAEGANFLAMDELMKNCERNNIEY